MLEICVYQGYIIDIVVSICDIVTMTIWKPAIDTSGVTQYVAIANAVARDIESGVLVPGDRLPTHRALADHLGVTVGTVTRGYAEAERRGLTVGEVGRGTFVRTTERDATSWATPIVEEDASLLDMSISIPATLSGGEEGMLLASTLRDIAADRDVGRLLEYNPVTGTPAQRDAGAAWITRGGFAVEGSHVVVTAGAQHGLTVSLSTLLRPGDLLLTAELTYPGVKSLAQMLGVRLQGLPLEGEGIDPDALAWACQGDVKPAAVYLVPTIQNPTGAIMSADRREAIANVAEKHGILVVEDDVHAYLPADAPPPIASLIPQRTVYLASVAKSLTPGLRTGFVVAPRAYRDRLLSGVRSTIWMPAPLMAEITARWIRDGTADTLLGKKRAETEARQHMTRDVLRAVHLDGHPNSYHVWMQLPDPWRSDEFVDQARQRGVLVAGAGAFVVGRRDVPHAVRVSIGAVGDRTRLRQGLEVLSELLEGTPDPFVSVL
jgi:DNA-binding transcriptional MocR family regulator